MLVVAWNSRKISVDVEQLFGASWQETATLEMLKTALSAETDVPQQNIKLLGSGGKSTHWMGAWS